MRTGRVAAGRDGLGGHDAGPMPGLRSSLPAPEVPRGFPLLRGWAGRSGPDGARPGSAVGSRSRAERGASAPSYRSDPSRSVAVPAVGAVRPDGPALGAQRRPQAADGNGQSRTRHGHHSLRRNYPDRFRRSAAPGLCPAALSASSGGSSRNVRSKYGMAKAAANPWPAGRDRRVRRPGPGGGEPSVAPSPVRAGLRRRSRRRRPVRSAAGAPAVGPGCPDRDRPGLPAGSRSTRPRPVPATARNARSAGRSARRAALRPGSWRVVAPGAARSSVSVISVRRLIGPRRDNASRRPRTVAMRWCTASARRSCASARDIGHSAMSIMDRVGVVRRGSRSGSISVICRRALCRRSTPGGALTRRSAGTSTVTGWVS